MAEEREVDETENLALLAKMGRNEKYKDDQIYVAKLKEEVSLHSAPRGTMLVYTKFKSSPLSPGAEGLSEESRGDATDFSGKTHRRS